MRNIRTFNTYAVEIDQKTMLIIALLMGMIIIIISNAINAEMSHYDGLVAESSFYRHSGHYGYRYYYRPIFSRHKSTRWYKSRERIEGGSTTTIYTWSGGPQTRQGRIGMTNIKF